ncbi:MAG: hypothetical protein HY821_10390 [Acidobacteria bacterium]|nr:hypothetical protein [Acidobacteriota bacterium]
MRTALQIILSAGLLSGVAFGQNAISAKAGMVNVADGDVYLVDAKGGEPRKLEPKPAEFVDIKEGQTLRTEEGRTEVLLTPGSFLRMADNSSFKLISSRLADVRIEVLSGTVMIEATEMLEGNQITALVKDSTVIMGKGGLYRFDADPARVRVYLGETVAEFNGQKATLKGGKELIAAAGGWTQGRFDAKETDPLYRWSKRRSGYIAMANVSAARQANSGSVMGFSSGRWYYNPYFGFATYIPFGDTLRSPFGYYYYTPSTVMAVYYPPRPVYGSGGGGSGFGGMNGGYAGMTQRSAGSGGGYSPSAGVSAPVSSPSMGAGSVGSRGGDGGGAAASAPAAGGGGARGGR